MTLQCTLTPLLAQLAPSQPQTCICRVFSVLMDALLLDKDGQLASLSHSHTQLHSSGLYRQNHLLGLGRRALLPHAVYFYNRQLPDRLLSGSEQSAALQQQEPEEPLHQLPTQPSTGRFITMRPWPQITPATWDHRQGSPPGSGLGGGVR